MKKTTLSALKAGTAPAVLGLAMISTGAFAQDTKPADDTADSGSIIVTGSRIARPNLDSNSPIAVVTGEETTARGDVTLDTFLNTLPQVNPAGTTTSNNPGNGGQSNINLRGLGSNRNLVLINGRRPMVSQSDQTVDLNTIPQPLIDRIDVMTGGAGATYGADAIAGVVNIILKKDFHGIDARINYANTVPDVDAREWQASLTAGMNFGDGKGNITISGEYAERQSLGKSQRAFASQATSTTNTPPIGRYISSGTNLPDATVIATVFAKYGVAAAQAPTASNIMFNTDGSLAGRGVFNSPIDVANYRYAANGTDAAAANQKFFPDFYSYNFDYVNFLVLPVKRKSLFGEAHYEFSPALDVFVQGNYTTYKSSDALAPTPVGTTIECATGTTVSRAKSSLVTCGKTITGLIAPITNPYIPADLKTILNSRTGDDTALVGTGAAEGVRISKRFLDTGLRQSTYTNTVYQMLGGVKGDFASDWHYEAYFSYGKTVIDRAAAGNVDVQKVENLLAAADGGSSLCAGGFNPFGINPLSAACVSYIAVTGQTKTTFTQKIAQAFVSGKIATLPAGDVSVVVGAEYRGFDYLFDPGALSGPIAGFNTATPAHGTNRFYDIFGEMLIPIASDASWAKSLELSLGYRYSNSQFNDVQKGITGKSQGSSAYKAELTWQPVDELRFRGSYQHSVRAPNFGELFDGGGSFPQYFDPCSATTNFIKNGGTAARGLCTATGVSSATYVQTPGTQALVGVAGNTSLKPEKGDTITLGMVFNSGRFVASLDYYNIRLKDTIFAPDANILIAACYNYSGKNAALALASPYCSGIKRTPDISFISVPAALGGDASGNFVAVNQGKIKTSGIDFQAAYKMPTDFAKTGSELNIGVTANYLLDYKVEELPGYTLNYAGTVSYFGAGLGTSFPKFKANLNLDWKLSPVTLSAHFRYINSMKNRASVQFPGEDASFTGVKSIIYTDVAAEVKIEQLTLRVGLNNAFNVKPPTYAPNVQSGTDPSLYDIIGRRAYISARIKY